MPQFLLDKPKLTREAYRYYDAYRLLDKSRQIGMDVFYIPLSEYMAYFEIFGINDADEREDIMYVVGSMEDEYFDWYTEHKARNKPKQ